jgi:hypothetical protein
MVGFDLSGTWSLSELQRRSCFVHSESNQGWLWKMLDGLSKFNASDFFRLSVVINFVLSVLVVIGDYSLPIGIQFVEALFFGRHLVALVAASLVTKRMIRDSDWTFVVGLIVVPFLTFAGLLTAFNWEALEISPIFILLDFVCFLPACVVFVARRL